jgi:NADH dehydrogenase
MSGARIVIVGAGFGGLQAARKLSGRGFELLLIDRHNYHLFQPLLYQVATAGLEPEHVAKSVRALLREHDDVRFLMAEVEGINLAARRIFTTSGELEFDYLVLAAGAENQTFSLPGIEAHSLPLKDLDDAVVLRNRLLGAFERASRTPDPVQRRAGLHFIIIGGGATGVEMAGALTELIEHVMRRDFPELDFDEVGVSLLEARDRLLPGMDPDLSEAARVALEDKGVRVRLEARVLSYDGKTLDVEGIDPIRTNNVIWTAGVRASRLVRELGVEHGPAGRAMVRQTLQLAVHPEVFVIGDAAYPEHIGKSLPMMAPVAIQMADHAAVNIVRLERGQTLLPFKFSDPGRLATIGRNAAVAQIGRLKFTGFGAWLIWLVVHLLRLIGFRNKLMVFLSWAWEYIFYDRAVRIIHGETPHPEQSSG